MTMHSDQRCRTGRLKREAVGRWLFRHRGVLPVPLVLATIAASLIGGPTLSGDVAESIDLAGLLLVGGGHFVRVWALGHAGPTTRSTRLQAPFLVESGPYAHVRNPLYVANIVIGTGIALVSGQAWLWPLLPLLLLLQYRAIVAAEERYLEERFGNRYRGYCAAVPRFWPRLRAYRNQPRRFAVRLCPGKEWQALAATGSMLLLFQWLKKWPL
jgi:protein-S-isoprenylcysteine O-methyltransferase Ste14